MNKFFLILESIKMYGLLKKGFKKFLEGEKNMNAKSFLQSKKVKVFLFGVIGLFLTNILGFEPEVASEIMDKLVTLVLGYIGVEGTKDLVGTFKAPPVLDAPKTDDK